MSLECVIIYCILWPCGSIKWNATKIIALNHIGYLWIGTDVIIVISNKLICHYVIRTSCVKPDCVCRSFRSPNSCFLYEDYSSIKTIAAVSQKNSSDKHQHHLNIGGNHGAITVWSRKRGGYHANWPLISDSGRVVMMCVYIDKQWFSFFAARNLYGLMCSCEESCLRLKNLIFNPFNCWQCYNVSFDRSNSSYADLLHWLLYTVVVNGYYRLHLRGYVNKWIPLTRVVSTLG